MFLDVSSVARWTGPPVGIIRVQSELARHAQAAGAATLVFFDPAEGGFRLIRPEWIDLVLGPSGSIDLWGRMRRARVSRYDLFVFLERRRLRGHGRWAGFVDRLQRALLAIRPHGLRIADAAGARLALIPFDMAVGEAIRPGPSDVVLLAGCGWYDVPVAQFAALRRTAGFRVAVICYDIIPLQRPDWFPPDDGALFRAYWDRMFLLADGVIVNAAVIGRDVAAYCAAAGLAAAPTTVVPLASLPAPPPPAVPLALPHGLRPGKFAMFVSTIEPRKGHGMLLRAWRRLLAQGAVGAETFQLVLVGRDGWFVDDVLRDLAALVAGGSVVRFSGAGDALLSTLYQQAAFCLYPSEYEGFGLPVVEAFAYGKAVIASTGGSLAEVAGALAPCLDPHDEAGWAALIGRWIAEPKLREAAEARIRAGFSPRGWDAVAAEVIAVARAMPAATPARSAAAIAD